MNINELAINTYGSGASSIKSIQSTGYVKPLKSAENSTKTENFSDILESYALSGDTDELIDSVKELQLEIEESRSDNVNKSDVMNILTDAHLAKEYMESTSGRNLIVSMIDNQIASIVSGNDKDDE